MKAVVFSKYGQPSEVVSVVNRPIPQPSRGQALVRILASPVNPADLLYVRGEYAGLEPEFPASLGWEGVGVIEKLGPGAADLNISQKVMFRLVNEAEAVARGGKVLLRP